MARARNRRYLEVKGRIEKNYYNLVHVPVSGLAPPPLLRWQALQRIASTTKVLVAAPPPSWALLELGCGTRSTLT